MSNSPFDPNSPLFPWLPPGPAPKPARPSLANLLAVQPQPPPPAWTDLLAKPHPKEPVGLGDLLGKLPLPPARPRVFISYQHSSDQHYYNEFSRVFHDGYESVYDNSLARVIDSECCEYVIQRIRDEFITGTSCTILLVGPTSYQRKYLDWEIKATLDKEHGLIGIHLPNLTPRWDGLFNVPVRFAENVRSGYALWIQWNALISQPHRLPALVSDASGQPKSRIVNPHEIMQRNG